MQALSGGHSEPGLWTGDFQGQLQMAYRVRRHQQLEAEHARQQVVPHVAGPRPCEPFVLDGSSDGRDDLAEEGACSGRRIENQNAGALYLCTVGRLDVDVVRIGKAVREIEPVTQQPVDAPHDVGHDRLRGVVDAPHLA